MTLTALLLFGVYLLVGFVARTVIQWRRTGDGGFRGLSGRVGSIEWWAGMLFVAALAAGGLGPVAALLGLDPIGLLVAWPVHAVGVTATILGVGATFWAQLQMGTSWRVGVDPGERTGLVTGGVFAVVRNPTSPPWR